jgi:dihydroorotase-like cyclic amidohydrolase
MHEGVESVRLGLRGIPAASEDVMVARDILLAQLTGARFHVAHISTVNAVAMVALRQSARACWSPAKPRRTTSRSPTREMRPTTAITK